ncbi:hypothetical protein COBT_000008 [Conglomerata obtusa]
MISAKDEKVKNEDKQKEPKSKNEKDQKDDKPKFLERQNAILPAEKIETHLFYNNFLKDFGIRENQNSIEKDESAKMIPNKKMYKILLGGQFMCFTKEGKKLIVCKSSDAKGSNWKIKKKENGYMIKNDKSTGFWFWNKEYCLAADKKLSMTVCDKKDKKQFFKIKDFFDALGSDPKKEDDEEESNEKDKSSSSSSSSDSDEKKKLNDNKPKEGSLTPLEKEYEKLDYNEANDLGKDEIITVTGNNKTELNNQASFGSCASASVASGSSSSSRQSEQSKSFSEQNEEKIDTDKVKNLIDDNMINKPSALFDTNTEKSEENKDFIGGSFKPIRPESAFKKSEADGTIINTDMENAFGVSKDIRSKNFNPLKAAASTIMMGIDVYMSRKYNTESAKFVCKDGKTDKDAVLMELFSNRDKAKNEKDKDGKDGKEGEEKDKDDKDSKEGKDYKEGKDDKDVKERKDKDGKGENDKDIKEGKDKESK